MQDIFVSTCKPTTYRKRPNGILLTKEVLLPEFVVGVSEVCALVALVAMHTVRIDHEVELLAGTMEGIQELESVLMVNVVISGSVGKLQHHRLDSLQ